MKILQAILFPLWGGGSGTYTRELSRHLASLGHEVLIVAPEERKIEGVTIRKVKNSLRAVFVNHPEWPDAKRYIELSNPEIAHQYRIFFENLTKAIEDFKPDVIHIHHCFILTWVASYIKGIYGINYVVSSHGTDVMSCEIDHRYHALTRDALMRAEYIVPVSPHTKRWLLKVFGRRVAWKIKVIPGGIDLSNFKKEFNLENFNRRHSLKNEKVVLYSGRLTKSKGVEYLLKAAPKIDAKIFIIGDGDEKKGLEELAQKLNLQNKVFFLGYFGKEKTDEMLHWYKRADVAVFPSIWSEPLGLVILEALAAGTPVVASKKGGIPLAVKNGYNGFLVRARSSKKIAEAVNKILNNEELRTKMSENARLSIETKFNWLNIAKQFEKLYELTYQKTQNSRRIRRLQREEAQRNLEVLKLEINRNKVDFK